MRPNDLGAATVKRALREVIRANHNAHGSRLAKVFPIAYPIVDVTYEVHQRLPERIGLVTRYAIDALCQFGPCSPKELDEFLGLGEDLSGVVLEGLLAIDSDVTNLGEKFVAGPSAAERLKSGFLGREVRHPRVFVVNGLTNTLLPIGFWDAHECWRLTIDPQSPNGPMRDAQGEHTAIFSLISDVMVDGLADLKQNLGSSDVETRRRVGIPEGATEVTSNQPQEIEVAWVLAFLLVHADQSVDIVTAGARTQSVLDDATRKRSYLERVCRRLSRNALDSAIDHESAQEEFAEWPTGVTVTRRAGEDTYCVSVDLPEKRLLLHDDVVPEDGDAGEQRPLSNDDKACRWLARAMVEGTYWIRDSGTVIRLVAGDRPTAEQVCVLRGCEALRARLATIDLDESKRPPIDLAVWWADWQRNELATNPGDVRPDSIAFDRLHELADRVPNTEFLAKLEWLHATSSASGNGAKK